MKSFKQSLQSPLSMGLVQRDSRFPKQHMSAQRFKMSVNWYQQQFHKHKELSLFHSVWELYFATLLEADPQVRGFVPQPFAFRIGKRRYTPDFYVERLGQIQLVEIKRDKELDESGHWTNHYIVNAMTDYCDSQGWSFQVVANSWVKKQQKIVERWLPIIRCLQHHKELLTDQQESYVLNFLSEQQDCAISDLIDPFDREFNLLIEIAVYRLAIAGQISLNLKHEALSSEARVRLV